MSIYRGMSPKEFYLSSSLYDSIEDHNLSAIDFLLKKGADPNIILPRVGIAPFHLIIGNDDETYATEITKLILQYDGNPNIQSDDGLTPLHISSAWGRAEITELLLLSGADPLIQDAKGYTPIDYSIECRHSIIRKLLNEFVSDDPVLTFEKPEKTTLHYDLTLDKVVLNNGQAVGEYRAIKNDINPTNTTIINTSNSSYTTADLLSLDQLPSYETNEFLDVWFNKLTETTTTGATGVTKTPSRNNCNNYPSDVASSLCSTFSDESDKLINKTNRSSSLTFNNYCDKYDYEINSLEKNVFDVDDEDDYVKKKNESEESFYSISEVYKYTDKIDGIVLYEKCYKVAPSSSREQSESEVSIGTQCSLPKSIGYDTDKLRRELQCRGYNPGPITKTTKKLYLRKLFRLEKEQGKNVQNTNFSDKGDHLNINNKVFSTELQKTITNKTWPKPEDLSTYKKLEELVSVQFSTSDHRRHWRGGNNKSSFTYLLLDPRVTKNLPARVDSLSSNEAWQIFLRSVFYVGKGKRTRPYEHVHEAARHFRTNANASNVSEKTKRIVDIWKSGGGIVCLHLFQNVIPAEAFTREAAILEALGLTNVTNEKRGEYYGVASTWSVRERQMYGAYLLHRALGIFLNEGERHLSPNDLD